MSARAAFIRERALALRARFEALHGLATGALPVVELAEQICELSAYDDPSLDPRVNGELNAYIGTIRLRPDMPAPRRRFVIAHELGHWALEGATTAFWEDDDLSVDERPGGDLEREGNVMRAYNTRERHEQEANVFALELLVPAPALWKAVTTGPTWTVEGLAERFGVSPDAILAQLNNVCCLRPPAVGGGRSGASTFAANDDQRRAVEAPLPLLVEAGPGTGKTRGIVAKYVGLVDAGVDPAAILALTYSNKAAEEMRERIVRALQDRPELAGRVEISTFHAWGLNFLREYGHHIGLPLNIKMRDRADLFVLLSRRLVDLPLDEYKMLNDPAHYLGQIMDAISRAKDELCAPEEYRLIAEAESGRLVAEAEAKHLGKTTKTAQEARDRAARDARRLRELAAIYARYQQILAQESVLDYGDLLMRAVEALHIPAVAEAMHARYDYILVDEFQDINYASGELVRLLDGGRGRVWAVGDPWQSIYRFRGASPANIAEFEHIYPNARKERLQLNYRSYQEILDAAHAVMAPDQAALSRQTLEAKRGNGGRVAVVEWEAPDEAAELAAIAHDILQRVGGRALRSARCAHPVSRHLRRVAHPSARPFRRRPRWGDFAVLCRSHREAARAGAVLEAHGIPVEATTDIYARAEVKDALAIAGCVRRIESTSLLRVLSMPEHALPPGDLTALVGLAGANKRSLSRAARDAELVAQLTPDAQTRLRGVLAMLESLSNLGDAWRVLSQYLWSWSHAMRERLGRAGLGDVAARRELAALGQLLIAARNFVDQAPPAARGARAFVDYLRELIAAREIQRTELGVHGDAVRIMSVHAAKGLEFPIVYVPFLREGRWPAQGFPSSIPALPGLIHGRLATELDEERYLLYVAMTRAKDKLILSRALMDGDKTLARSPLLLGAGKVPPWPVHTVAGERACVAPVEPVRLRIAPAVRMPVAASGLDTYADCPRKYLYQYGYQLYDDVSPYLRMHQTIRDAVDELGERACAGSLPPDEAGLSALVRAHFARHELFDELYSDDLLDEAMGHARQLWQDLQGGTISPADVRRRFELQRPVGTISVAVDRIEDGSAGPRWVRVKSGQQKNDDTRDTRIILYMQAYAEAHGAEPDVAIHYTRTGERRPARPGRDTRDRHLEKIDGYLTGIAAGRWQPNPGRRCAECPFVLLCPA